MPPTSQVRSLPSIAQKLETAHRWLAMHEKANECKDGGGGGGGGGGGDGGARAGSLSKAERVFKDMLFERATGDAEVTA